MCQRPLDDAARPGDRAPSSSATFLATDDPPSFRSTAYLLFSSAIGPVHGASLVGATVMATEQVGVGRSPPSSIPAPWQRMFGGNGEEKAASTWSPGRSSLVRPFLINGLLVALAPSAEARRRVPGPKRVPVKCRVNYGRCQRGLGRRKKKFAASTRLLPLSGQYCS